MTINELNELTRTDLIAIDEALIMLARWEMLANKNTHFADKATKALNRIAVRYSLVPADGTARQAANS
jgi:hypothetical protein